MGLDPYMYTSGRWLNRDELERNSRHIVFDFSALCDRLSLYVQEQKGPSISKREKVELTESFSSQWTQVPVLWRDYRPALLARQG
jgi:hypothetical protein